MMASLYCHFKVRHSRCVVVVLVVGPISTAAVKAYCTLTPVEFRHSSPKALLAKDGTKAKEFS
jgi:hypothetical protein